MNIVIVAKTRMRDGVCIGGIDEESGTLIRLLPNRNSHGWPRDTSVAVGDIWSVQAAQAEVVAPHVEDLIVSLKQKIGVMKTLRAFITNRFTPWTGSTAQLFDGHIRYTSRGRGFVAARCGVPRNSVGFWLLPMPLKLVKIDGKPYYTVFGSTPPITIKYVGTDEPDAELPTGRLVRLSLARWWSPADMAGMEPRCYLQLSGWYTDSRYEREAQPARPRDVAVAQQAEVHEDYGDAWIEYGPADLEDEEWYEQWTNYDDYDPWEDRDDTWGGTFVLGSDDPPGAQHGSDFAGCIDEEDDDELFVSYDEDEDDD